MASISREDLLNFGPRARANPGAFCRHFLGADLWDQQVKILESVRDNERTAVVACHSIGKSYLTACSVIWFLLAHPDSKVIMTAPTWRQVVEVLWGQVRSIYTKSPVLLPGEPLIAPKWEIAPGWMALGFSATEPERLQGFHAPYILVVVDEASGVKENLFDALRSLGASGEVVRYLLLSNATRPEGELHAAFHHKRAAYSPGLFQISCWDTPNFLSIREECLDPECTPAKRIAILRATAPVRPYLIRPKYVADAEAEFGWDSDYYRVRCLGQFPKGGDGILIPLWRIEEAVLRWESLQYDKAGKRVPQWWEELHKVPHTKVVKGALDVARFGSNDSVFGARLDGVVAPFHSWNGLSTVELTGNVQDLIRQYNVREMAVDEDGLGGGPLDNLIAWGGHPGFTARGFKGGARPRNVERFGNLRAEAWHDLAARYEQGRIAHARNDRLMGQVSAIKYKYRIGGQRMMQSKDEIVADGRESPDFGDMLAMLFSQVTEGMAIEAWTGEESTNWDGMFG